VLLRVLETTLEHTSFYGEEASLGNFPITSREDDSLTAVNVSDDDGNRQPGQHVLYGLTERIAVYAYASGSYRNAAGGITTSTENGTCRRVIR
jgi:hypothetical protein